MLAIPETAPAAPFAVPEPLIKWIPFIRAARFQGYPHAKIAEVLLSAGVLASPDDVRSIVTQYHGRRHPVPVAKLLDQYAPDIERLADAGQSEQKICLWLAAHRGLAVHQCQLNTWARARRNKAT